MRHRAVAILSIDTPDLPAAAAMLQSALKDFVASHAEHDAQAILLSVTDVSASVPAIAGTVGQ